MSFAMFDIVHNINSAALPMNVVIPDVSWQILSQIFYDCVLGPGSGLSKAASGSVLAALTTGEGKINIIR